MINLIIYMDQGVCNKAIFLKFSFLQCVDIGGFEAFHYRHWRIGDVRDVAEALLLTYKKPEAQGRYICTAHAIWLHDLVDKLKSIYFIPTTTIPKSN